MGSNFNKKLFLWLCDDYGVRLTEKSNVPLVKGKNGSIEELDRENILKLFFGDNKNRKRWK